MSKLKTKEVAGLQLKFDSSDPKDFVDTLNKIAEVFGGVSNMGVFADITSVQQSNEMIAHVEDKYVVVNTRNYEKPHRDLVITTNVVDPYQFDLDTLVGKNGSNIPSSLEQFLENANTKGLEQDDEDDDEKEELEIEEEEPEIDDDDVDDEEEDEDEDDEDEDDESVSDAFREVGKDLSSAFKETAGAFKGAFKFKK